MLIEDSSKMDASIQFLAVCSPLSSCIHEVIQIDK